MCGRYTLTKKQLRFASRFSKEALQIFLKERYNIAPTQTVPIIYITAGKLVSEEVRWGLQPAWSKAPIINAQCEGILKKPTFRQSVLQRRCLVPADGFYEWQGKTPLHLTFPERELFYFGGIIDSWITPDKPVTLCCSIITTAANEVVRRFHKRMPFILGPNDYDTWLDPATTSDQLEQLFQRPDGAVLQVVPSRPLVPDGAPSLVKPSQSELAFGM